MIWLNREDDLNETREIVIPLLQALIQNRCVNFGTRDGGSETKNALILKNFFNQKGINSQLIGVIPNRDSFISVIEGSDANPKVYALMGHIDVVPADESKWDFDPFSGDFDGEWLYGRGAVDMLNQIAIMAAALREVISERGTPNHTVKFFAFADEEADGVLGADALLKSHPQLLECDHMLTELGGYFIDPTHISIAPCEKGVLRVHLIAHGKSGHGSMPYGADNAALKITEAISRVCAIPARVNYTPEALRMIEAMPLSRSIKEKLLIEETVEEALAELSLQSLSMAKLIHSSLFLTISLGIVRGGCAVNVIPDYAEAYFDLRIQQGETRESVLTLFENALEGLDIELYEREYFSANSSSMESSFYQNISTLVSEYYPDAKLVPVVPAGVTDGRYFRKMGTEVYSFSLFSKKYTYDFFASGLHGVNEKIDLESLALGFSFYKNLLSRILYTNN